MVQFLPTYEARLGRERGRGRRTLDRSIIARAPRAPRARGDRSSGVRVDDRALLDVRPRADGDGVVVAAQDAVEPDGAVLAEGHVADDVRARRDPDLARRRERRRDAAQRVELAADRLVLVVPAVLLLLLLLLLLADDLGLAPRRRRRRRRRRVLRRRARASHERRLERRPAVAAVADDPHAHAIAQLLALDGLDQGSLGDLADDVRLQVRRRPQDHAARRHHEVGAAHDGLRLHARLELLRRLRLRLRRRRDVVEGLDHRGPDESPKATADQKLPRRSVRGGLQKRIIMNCKNPGRRNMAAQPGGASTWGTDGRDLLGGEASINRPLSVSSIGQRRQGTYIFATGLPAAGVWGSGANPSRARGRSSA